MRKIVILLILLASLVVACGDVPSTEDAIQEAAEVVENVAGEVADNAETVVEKAEEVVEEVKEEAAAVVEEVENATSGSDLPDEITVAYFLEWPTPNQVAQLENTYDEVLGVPVNWVSFDTGVAMSAAMASGDVQIAYSQGLVPFANAVTSGLDIQMVGVAVSYAENDNCVGRTDLGLTRDNITDLHGEKVAVPIGTVAHYKMLKELQYLGVDTDQLEIVDLAPADGAAALQRGDVAMSCGWGGALARMKEAGSIIMTGAEMEDEIGLKVFDVTSVTNDFAEQYPDLVTAFLQVTEDANAAYGADQGKLGVIAEAAGMDEESTASSLATFSFPNASAQLSDAWLGGTVETFVTEVANFFVEQGELDAALDDYGPTINTSFLENVNSASNTWMGAMAADDSMAEEAMDDGIPRGGTLVTSAASSPRHLNPAVQSGTGTAIPGTQLFASPLRYDAEWNPHPYLAESWEVSDDGLMVTLNLVQGATFHDGEAITSEDVKFSLETVKANHPFQSMYAPVTEVETPDDYTVIIHLEHPHPAILLAMSSALLPVIPEHIYNDGQDMKTHPRNSEDVIGSGPFKLNEYVPGESIILDAYEDFFIEGRPYLDRIVIKINPDNNSTMIEMENGDIDIMTFVSGSRDIARLTDNPEIDVTDQGYAAVGAINWLAYNTKDEILSDVRVRQAIAYAIDREFITEALHGGFSKPAYGPIHGDSPFANSDIEHYDLDLDKANALLDEAGYPMDGDSRFSLTVDYIPGPAEQQQNVAEYLKSQLAEVGIDIEVRAAPDFPTWAGRVSSYDFDLSMDILFNWGDPVIGVHRTYLSTNIVEGVIWSNTQQYANDRVDELLNAAAKETDVDARIALYAEFHEIVAEELPVYWINTMPNWTASQQWVKNVPVTIWGAMAPMDEVYIDGKSE